MYDKMLDNITCQEIKEMVINKEIQLDELDSRTLTRLMNYEIDMICFGEGDTELIKKCTDIVNNREEITLPKERFSEIIENTHKEYVVIKNNTSKITLRKAIKRALIIVAATFVISAGTIGIAYAFDFDIIKYLVEIAKQPRGTAKDVDRFTFYNNSDARMYDSQEEMEAVENIHIMYPTKWPEGVTFQKIYISTHIDGKDIIDITTDNTTVGIMVVLSDEPFESSVDDIFVHEGIKFYIDKNQRYTAYCFHNNNIYYFSANTREDLILIIENLKE